MAVTELFADDAILGRGHRDDRCRAGQFLSALRKLRKARIEAALRVLGDALLEQRDALLVQSQPMAQFAQRQLLLALPLGRGVLLGDTQVEFGLSAL